MSDGLAGVIAAVLTPLTGALQPDLPKASAYYRWLLDNGCDGLNVLGTTGEAMSLSVRQRISLMQHLASDGVALDRMMVGTGSASLADTIALTTAALDAGFGGVLVMPPFFYRGATDDGILEFFDALARATQIGPGLLYLYNFPQMSGTTFALELVRRLHGVVPIAGLKDSSNDLPYAQSLHDAFPQLRIFPSSESHARHAKHAGLAGCISGTVALWPHVAGALWNRAEEPQTELLQIELSAMRDEVTAHPLIPAVRFLVALQQKDPSWERPLPPLQAIDDAARESLRGLLSP